MNPYENASAEEIAEAELDGLRTVMQEVGYNEFQTGIKVYGSIGMIALTLLPPDEGEADDAVSRFTRTLSLARVLGGRSIGQLEIVMLAGDGYVTPSDTPLDNARDAFLAGDPRVGEAIRLTVFTPKGATEVTQGYKYTPVDGWEWATPEYVPVSDGPEFWELLMAATKIGMGD